MLHSTRKHVATCSADRCVMESVTGCGGSTNDKPTSITPYVGCHACTHTKPQHGVADHDWLVAAWGIERVAIGTREEVDGSKSVRAAHLACSFWFTHRVKI